jgi:lysophospholipase L1-like esterase
MTTTQQANTYPDPPYAGVGIGCGIFARMSARVPVLGILGDSISHGTGDNSDPLWGGAAIERGLRAQIPVINVSCQGDEFSLYFTRPDGRAALLDGSITHLLVSLGRNDVSVGRPAPQIAHSLETAVAPYLARGVKVYAVTITPQSVSTDKFATVQNQLPYHPDHEAVRLAHNAWLRRNWQRLGLSGIFDWAHAVDPLDSGIWPAHGGCGNYAVGVPTLADGTIAGVRRAVFSTGQDYGGRSYPPNQAAHPCIVQRYPDDPARSGDAVITCTTDAEGVVTSFAVVESGHYTIAPMVMAAGCLTTDGTHPTGLGYNLMIAGSGFGPQAFTL